MSLPRFIVACTLPSVLLLFSAGLAAGAPATREFVPVQAGPVTAAPEVPVHATDHVLVKLTDDTIRASRLGESVLRGSAEAAAAIGVPAIDAVARAAGATIVRRAHILPRNQRLDRAIGVSRWFLYEIPEGSDVIDLASRFADAPGVEAATPDWIAFPAAVPSDPLHPDHWGHNNTGQLLDYCWGCGGHPSGSPVGTPGFDANAHAAWDGAQGYGSSGVVVAILDSGVDVGHPDLNQVAGWDYGDNDSNPDDNSSQPGHGTACAGVAAAIASNGLGSAGIAGGCSIMPLKVANSAGSMYFSAIQNALVHAADNGADVASMSLGAAISSDPATDNALLYAHNAGVTLLAATGNENASAISYPANYVHVIAVGAASPCGGRKRSSSSSSEVNPGVNTDPNGYTCDGERWWGSNYGSTVQNANGAVDLIAPTILPTTDIQGSGGYDPSDYSRWFNGTSCATPYAAGVAALVISNHPTWTPDQVRDQLRTTADDVVNVEAGAGWDRYSGYGMIDAAAAVGSGGPPPTQDYATLPYSTGFETGSLDTYWTTASTGNGRVRVLSSNGPYAGSWHLTMDDPTNGGYTTNEAWLHLNLAGESNVDLDFRWKEFGDETHSQDGVYFSDDAGASFVKVQNLNGQSYTNNTWQSFSLDVDALASANGLSLSSTFVVKLQQYDNYPIATDGHAYDEISVTSATGPANSVTLTSPNGGETLTAGTVHTITWTSTGSIANVALESSTNAGSSWTSITSSTPNDGSYDWTVPSTATNQGRVRVSDAADAGVNDQSNSNFTIDVPPPSGNYATVPYSTGFESGTLDNFWTTSSTSNGRVRILSSNGPHSGTYHLTMDDPTRGGYAQNEAWLRLDLSGESQVDLDFWWKEFGDETHSQDGVYFSANDGASFVKVQNLNGQSYSNNTWQSFSLDLDALAAANGLSLSSTFVVKFQQYDNYPIATDGFAFDDVSVTAGSTTSYITAESEPNGGGASADGPMGTDIAVSGTISSSSDDDWFWFDVASSGTVSIILSIGSSADLDWYLYAESDLVNWVARGYTVNNPETGNYNASPGRYYLRVDGYLGATSPYTVTISGVGVAVASGPEKSDIPLPVAFALGQNAPNPFRGQTSIRLAMPRPGEARIVVYDLAGRRVRTLVEGSLPAGVHELTWDGRDESGQRVAAGVYLYRVETEGLRTARKMMLLR